MCRRESIVDMNHNSKPNDNILTLNLMIAKASTMSKAQSAQRVVKYKNATTCLEEDD